MYDLHIHTTFSDGSDDVKQIIKKIKENKIVYFSLTDHDCIKANVEMKKYEAQLIDCGIIYINGVEFSCQFKNAYEMHILCYDFCYDDNNIALLAKKAETIRLEKIEKMLENLSKKHNIILPTNKIEGIKKLNIALGKPHIARIMIEEGYGNNITEIIEKYLDDIKNIECKIDAITTIKIIRECGAFSVLAHPKEVMKEYNLGYESLENLVKELKDVGLEGLEVYHNSHSAQDIKEFKNIANKLNLYISGGSDYHGINKPNVKLLNLGENVTKNDLKDMVPFLLEMLN